MQAKKPSFELRMERALFASRWLMAPFYFGLVVALMALLAIFGKELWEGLHHIFTNSAKIEDAILLCLSLIDLSLAGNLLLIVIFAGYENFVSRIDVTEHEDRPSWMGTVDFSGLKIKLVASIVAISAIALLKSFMEIADPSAAVSEAEQVKLWWLVVIHMSFVASGVLLATMDYISSRTIRH